MVLKPSTPSKLLTLAALTLITLLLLPQTATAITTNMYKGILGDEGAQIIYSISPIPIIRPGETSAFWVWRTSLNNMFNEFQLEGKYVSKFDVLYEISNHPTYDPDWLKAEVIIAINTTAPNSNLIMFGHMTPYAYTPYRFLLSYYWSGGNIIPDSWAVPGNILVWANDVDSVTLSKPVSELPGFIVLIGCESLPVNAIDSNDTWAHTFKFSKRFYPYTIYWYQRGILGFNDTVEYSNIGTLIFIERTLEYAQTKSMGDALEQSARENNVNLVLQYYTGRYTYSTEYYDNSGTDTAVYVGDYDLTIDPTLDNEVAEKVIGYIKTRYPEIHDLLKMISDGLVRLEVGDTLLHFPGFGSVTQLEMKFDKNLTDLGARVVAWLTAYLWNGNIIKFSVTADVITDSPKGAEWARSFGERIADIINGSAIPAIRKAGLSPVFMDRSRPPNKIDYTVIPYIDDVPVYLGAQGTAYVSSLVIDRLEERGYLTFTFVDNTPYLQKILENAAPTNNVFKLSENDALRSIGLERKKAKVIKAWALLPQGLTPTYIVRYSDDAGEQVRVVDASTGAVLYSSDGGLGGVVAPLAGVGQGLNTAVIIVAAAAASVIAASLLWRKLRVGA